MANRPELHRTHHIGWLRAAVLGANDGAISTASLVVGVAAANSSQSSILVAGLAGLVAGALAMAAGEYVSVSSQADTEKADLRRELQEHDEDPEAELHELAAIYRARGLSPELAIAVAEQLTKADALGAHAREELGIVESQTARPLQAAITSAAMFSVGAVVPLTAAWTSPAKLLMPLTISTTLVVLLILGALAARVGGASPWIGAFRVASWGAVAMAVTAGVGRLFHIAM